MTHDPYLDQLEPVEQRSPMVRTLVTVLVTLVVVGSLLGGLVAVSVAVRDTRSAVNEVDVSGVPQLGIRSASADVRLVEGDGDTVRVTAEVTSGIRETTYELRRRGEEIEVVAECLTWLSPGCGVAVTVEVPAALPVLVATGSGDVVAEDLTDRVLTLATGSGDVRGSGLVLDELSARTGSGDLAVDFSEPPFAVKVRTGSGDVDVRLPGGALTYSVDVRSRSGDVRSALDDDPAGDGFVRVDTGSGDVDLRRE